MILAMEDGDMSIDHVSESLKNKKSKMENMYNKNYLKDSIKSIINNANKGTQNNLIMMERMHLVILLIIMFINCSKFNYKFKCIIRVFCEK